MTSPRRVGLALVGCAAVGVPGWIWMQPDSHDATEADAIGGARDRIAPTPGAQQAGPEHLDVHPGTSDDVTHHGAAPLAPDGGALPDRLTLQAMGAVVAEPGDVSPGSIPPPEMRLVQARGAIVAFSDTVERLQGELNEAQQTGVRDTSSIERRLAAASRSLELARFAERATEAELDGHPL